jgi:hypothetical protein
MGKSFSDVLAGAGYATRNVSNPTVIREIPDEGIGAGFASDSPGGDAGPSLRFMDEIINHKKVPRAFKTPPINDHIETPIKKEVSGNPYTNPNATTSESEIPSSVLKATSNRRTAPPLPDFAPQIP